MIINIYNFGDRSVIEFILDNPKARIQVEAQQTDHHTWVLDDEWVTILNDCRKIN